MVTESGVFVREKFIRVCKVHWLVRDQKAEAIRMGAGSGGSREGHIVVDLRHLVLKQKEKLSYMTMKPSLPLTTKPGDQAL